MTVRKAVTILRKPDGKWNEVETAKAMIHFNTAVGTDPRAPGDLAIVGKVKEELVEEFRLAHKGFENLKMLSTYGTMQPE